MNTLVDLDTETRDCSGPKKFRQRVPVEVQFKFVQQHSFYSIGVYCGRLKEGCCFLGKLELGPCRYSKITNKKLAREFFPREHTRGLKPSKYS